MKVLALTRYNYLGPSSRLRFYQYLPYLKEHGIAVTIAPLLGDDYLSNLFAGKPHPRSLITLKYLHRISDLMKSRNYDLLWIEKELFPWIPGWTEQFLGLLKVPYVLDYDDAIFHSYDLNKRKFVRFFLGDKIKKIMAGAAIVIVGNNYLADYAHRSGAARVEVIPTVIDLNRYNNPHFHSNKLFTIGWIGSPSTAKFLYLVQSALAEVCYEGHAQVVLVGSGPILMQNVQLDIRSWEENSEVKQIQSFNAGIMPLFDEPWERGKCGYKLIQYMACGVPVVASPVGINSEIIEHGINGFVARDRQEWVYYLNLLKNQPDLCIKLGEMGRKKVESHFCVQVTAPLLAKLLQKAASK